LPRRIREHVEHQQLRRARPRVVGLGQRTDRVGGSEGLVLLPVVLPTPLDLAGQRGGVPERRHILLWLGHLGHVVPHSSLPAAAGLLTWWVSYPGHKKTPPQEGSPCCRVARQHGLPRSSTPGVIPASVPRGPMARDSLCARSESTRGRPLHCVGRACEPDGGSTTSYVGSRGTTRRMSGDRSTDPRGS